MINRYYLYTDFNADGRKSFIAKRECTGLKHSPRSIHAMNGRLSTDSNSNRENLPSLRKIK
jgi:hypothetical protein